MKKNTISKKFERVTGPRVIFGSACIEITEQKGFSIKFNVVWPKGYDAERYNQAIKEGIVQGFSEAGYLPTGMYRIISVEFSDCDEENVPFAYKEAARLIIREIIDK
jgi:hypothetical protein